MLLIWETILFFISLGTFFQASQIISFVPSLIVSIALFLSFSVVFDHVLSVFFKNQPIYSRLLFRLARFIRFLLATVVIEDWIDEIQVIDQSKSSIKTILKGKINFGMNHYIDFVIQSQPQARHADPKEPFNVTITNLVNNRNVNPEFVTDEPTYKVIRIKFGSVLTRGAKFAYQINYELKNSFFLDRKDWWYHTARRHEKNIVLRVNFPKEYIIKDFKGNTITEYGDDTWGRSPKDQPTKVDPICLEWKITDVIRGTKHQLDWELEKT